MVAQQILTVQIIPILLGAAITEWVPNLGQDLFEPVSKVGNFLLLGALIIILIISLPTLLEVGWGNVVSILLFVVAMVAIGHFLGGPDPQTRITMALANSSRNAGLALVLVTLNLDEAGTLDVAGGPVGKTPIIGVIGAIALLASVIGTIYVNVYQKQLTR